MTHVVPAIVVTTLSTQLVEVELLQRPLLPAGMIASVLPAASVWTNATLFGLMFPRTTFE